MSLASALRIASAIRSIDEDPWRIYAEGEPGKGGMSPGQREFHESLHRLRAMRAANQVGKSHGGAWEAWAHALGTHPYRTIAAVPNVGWIVIAAIDVHWPIISEKLHDVQPRGALAENCDYVPGKGYMAHGRRMVVCSNGSRMEPKSGKQAVVALASGTIDWLWIDEPPRSTHWGEALSRVAVRQGPVWLTFTPMDVSQDLGWLKLKLEGDADKGIEPEQGWHQVVIELTAANCPHRTQGDIDAQVAVYLDFEREQRVRAAWEGVVTERMLANFDGSQEFDWIGAAGWDGLLPGMEQPVTVGLGLTADHGEVPGAEYWLLYAYLDLGVDSMVWALDEYISPSRTTVPSDVLAIAAMLEDNGLTVADIDRWHGDTNSAGKVDGGSVNSVYSRHFNALLQQYPGSHAVRIQPAVKGPGSVLYGTRVVNYALGSRHLHVSRRCAALLKSMRRWRGGTTGEDRRLKDRIDGLRYGAVQLLDQRVRNLAHLRTA